MTLHLPFERNDIATKWPFTHASAWAEKLKSAAASLTEKKQDASDDALSAELVVKDHSQTKSYPIDVVPDGMGDAKILQLDSLHTKDLIFFDKKLENTAFIESAITYIDGENKILLYRGYPIEQLAKSSTYLETAYLLRDGELPDEEEYAVYKKRVLENMKVDPDMLNILKSYPPGTPPMLLINIMLSSMGAFYRDFGTRNTEEGRDNITTNLVAKTPAIVAAAIRASRQKTPEDLKNLTFIDPDPSKGYVENFLRMCFAKDNETEYTSDPVAIESLNCLFICHGDHEQNASTNTIRLVASTDAPWCATFPAGIGSLWGRLHGGAAQASAEMLERIGTPENVEAFIEDVKTNGAKVMGFGHRIYKNGDPRADIIEEKCKMLLTLPGEEVWDNLSEDDKKKYHLLQTADKLENAISNDEYFRKLRPGKSPEDEDAYQLLRPNVDFRSGILYHMMGFHPQEYTALFALARMAGWAAQWNEDFDKGKRDLGRPRQRYVGKECRDFVARKDRPPSKPQKPVVAPDSAEAAPKI